MVAEDLGIDQVEIRTINAVTDNWRTANGMMVDVSGLPECIKESPRKSDGRKAEKKDPRKGNRF